MATRSKSNYQCAIGGNLDVLRLKFCHNPILVRLFCHTSTIYNIKILSQSIPKRLYIQLDNTARENKNRCVLSFLSLLVELGVFEEVQCIVAAKC